LGEGGDAVVNRAVILALKGAILVLAPLAFFAVVSAAVPFGAGTANWDGPPPLRFQGDASAVVSFQSDVSGDCGKAPRGLVILACEFSPAKGVPVIVLPNPNQFPNDPYARIVAHELAHRSGWAGNHPL
jgi:hypothetical protein